MNNDYVKYCSHGNSLIAKNGCYTNIENKLNLLLFGDNLHVSTFYFI